jgi:hypothetical protein
LWVAYRAAGIGGEVSEIRAGAVQAKKARGKGARRVAHGPEKKSRKSVAGSRAVQPGMESVSAKTGTRSNAAEPEKRSRGNGLKRLQRAADRRLGRASETLADVLLKKAKEGRLESARLLVTLAERRKERKPQEKKKKKREGPSWAELLASEPEWEEEKPEIGDVWVGDGWRKQGTGEIVREGQIRD